MSFFEWADEQGLSIAELSKRLQYSERHLWRIKAGDSPITEGFKARVVYAFGDATRSLFLDPVSDEKRRFIGRTTTAAQAQ